MPYQLLFLLPLPNFPILILRNKNLPISLANSQTWGFCSSPNWHIQVRALRAFTITNSSASLRPCCNRGLRIEELCQPTQAATPEKEKQYYMTVLYLKVQMPLSKTIKLIKSQIYRATIQAGTLHFLPSKIDDKDPHQCKSARNSAAPREKKIL